MNWIRNGALVSLAQMLFVSSSHCSGRVLMEVKEGIRVLPLDAIIER